MRLLDKMETNEEKEINKLFEKINVDKVVLIRNYLMGNVEFFNTLLASLELDHNRFFHMKVKAVSERNDEKLKTAIKFLERTKLEIISVCIARTKTIERGERNERQGTNI